MWILEVCVGLALCQNPTLLLTQTKAECESVQVSVVRNVINTPGVFTRCRIATVDEIHRLGD